MSWLTLRALPSLTLAVTSALRRGCHDPLVRRHVTAVRGVLTAALKG